MTDTLQQEDQIIDSIVERLIKLGDDIDTMETTDGRLQAYAAQEKAISEIRYTIREAEHLDWISTDTDDGLVLKADDDAEQMGKALVQIDYTLQKLEKALEALSGDNTSKLKAWYEQRKALHEVKRILHLMGRYIGYDADELSMATPD